MSSNSTHHDGASNTLVVSTMRPDFELEEGSDIIDFLNKVHADATYAQTAKHISFKLLDDDAYPVSYFVGEELRVDTSAATPIYTPVYDDGVTEATKNGLKGNGFEMLLINLLNQYPSFDDIPKDQMFLLHIKAIAPCKNVILITIPKEWYEHTNKAFKDELKAILPKLDVGTRTRVAKSVLAQIGGEDNDELPAADDGQNDNDELRPAEDEQVASQDDRVPMDKPRCRRCISKKKGCDRKRPCGTCVRARVGIEGCVSEDEGNRGVDGNFGGKVNNPSGKNKYTKQESSGDASRDKPASSAVPNSEPPKDESVPSTGEPPSAPNNPVDLASTSSFFDQAARYLQNKQHVENFLILYSKFVEDDKLYTVDRLLDSAGRHFFKHNRGLFDDLKNLLRDRAGQEELTQDYTRFLDAWYDDEGGDDESVDTGEDGAVTQDED